MNKKIAVLLLSIVAMAATLAVAGSDPMVGGHEMSPSKNIIQNAVNSDDHTTLVAAVKAAYLSRSRRPVQRVRLEEGNQSGQR